MDKQASKQASERLKLASNLLFFLLFSGCSADKTTWPEDPEREDLSAAQLPLTDVIPTSALCNLGHGPSRCIHVPLIPPAVVRVPPETPSENIHTFTMDGVRGEKEWSGAVQLAYSNEASKAGDGKIYLALPQTAGLLPAPGVVTLTDLVLFFENFPVDTRPVPGETGVVRVYLDFQRFTGEDELITTNDRLFEFDIINGVPLRRLNGSPEGEWSQVSLSGVTVATTANHCQPDPSSNVLQRCNAEVKIRLPSSALAKPDPLSSVLPGFGLLITDGQTAPALGKVSSYPAGQSFQGVDESGRQRDRRTWETILIGRPRGFPLRFMSWNVRRFKSDELKGDFSSVSNADIGKFLAPNDVVALQEGWDTASVKEIWQHANVARDALGLPPFREPYSPPTIEAPQKQSLLEYLGALLQGEPEVHGGLWIFSHLPAKAQGQRVFQRDKSNPNPMPYCKGEDCLKSKGVQWVRLNLNPADGPAASCNLKPKSELDTPPGELAASCPPSPSGDHFVDIFNTHLQASEPDLCESIDGAVALLANLPESSPSGVLQFAAERYGENFHCDVPDAVIRAEQIRQFNAFIEDTATEKDRPAILLGDFNIDGKNTSDGEYNAMLKALRIGPEGDDGNPPSDIINPWRFDFDDDYDHGDVLRERSDIPQVDPFAGPTPGSFKPVGTHISGDGGGFIEGGTQLATDVDRIEGNERLDYILSRPPFRPESPGFKTARWVALKPQGDTAVWSSPWPGEKDPAIVLGGTPPLPPERFSDHKPVVSTIELTQLSQPPVYHPTWKHDWVYRVSSANASGISDCFKGFDWLSEKCKNVDLYNYIASARVELSGGGLVFVPGPDKITKQSGDLGLCDEQSVAQFAVDTCTHDWFVAGKHTSTSQLSHDGSSALLDDEVNEDGFDVLPRNSEDHARFPWVKTIWDAPAVQNRGQIEFLMSDTDFSPDQWEKWSATVFVEDGAPVGACTKNSIPFVCVENSFKELPPGSSFEEQGGDDEDKSLEGDRSIPGPGGVQRYEHDDLTCAAGGSSWRGAGWASRFRKRRGDLAGGRGVFPGARGSRGRHGPGRGRRRRHRGDSGRGRRSGGGRGGRAKALRRSLRARRGVRRGAVVHRRHASLHGQVHPGGDGSGADEPGDRADVLHRHAR